MNDYIRRKAGRARPAPERQGAYSAEEIEDVCRVMGMTKAEAIAWLAETEGPPPAGNAGAGTGKQPARKPTMNDWIRRVAGRG